MVRRRAATATALAAVAALAVGLAGYALSTPPRGADDAARAAAQGAAETPGGGEESPSAVETPSDSPAEATAEPTEDDADAGAKEDAEKDAAKEADASQPTGSPDAPGVAPDARLAETEQPVADPVAFGKKATAGSFEVSVSKLEAIEGKAEGIGEVAGPAIRFVVTVRNTSDTELSLDAAVVTAEYGKDAVPATELSQSGAKGFPATVAAGKDASGTFVFQVPTKERGSVRILVNQSASEKVAAFEGAAPTGKG
ncbi:DUF4352 domain-containing protein [Arthrobacter ginkgonis]|uniref:DUF4352 domain-containing protein n=1 Tax=Arthrobacter ginkgonis TaxID=1630594 RepID=UPI0031EADC38